MHLTFGASSQYLAGEGGNPGYLNGCLDDVSIYNRALAPYEIMMLFVDKPGSVYSGIAKSISVYPNPTSNIINISNSNGYSILGYSTKIYNKTGQLVYSSKADSEQLSIALQGTLPNGIYFLELIDPNNKVATIRKKIVLFE